MNDFRGRKRGRGVYGRGLFRPNPGGMYPVRNNFQYNPTMQPGAMNYRPRWQNRGGTSGYVWRSPPQHPSSVVKPPPPRYMGLPPIRPQYPGRSLLGTPPLNFNPSLIRNRPPSPLPGSEEARQKTIAEASARIKEQLNLEAGSVPLQSAVHSAAAISANVVMNDKPVKTPEQTKKKRLKTPRVTVDKQELRNKIVKEISTMSKGKIQSLINNPGFTKYDTALQHLLRDARLNASSELRTLYNSRTNTEGEIVNSVVPDLGVELASLPDTLVDELSNILQIDLSDPDPHETLENSLIEPEQLFKQAELMLNNSMPLESETINFDFSVPPPFFNEPAIETAPFSMKIENQPYLSVSTTMDDVRLPIVAESDSLIMGNATFISNCPDLLAETPTGDSSLLPDTNLIEQCGTEELDYYFENPELLGDDNIDFTADNLDILSTPPTKPKIQISLKNDRKPPSKNPETPEPKEAVPELESLETPVSPIVKSSTKIQFKMLKDKIVHNPLVLDAMQNNPQPKSTNLLNIPLPETDSTSRDESIIENETVLLQDTSLMQQIDSLVPEVIEIPDEPPKVLETIQLEERDDSRPESPLTEDYNSDSFSDISSDEHFDSPQKSYDTKRHEHRHSHERDHRRHRSKEKKRRRRRRQKTSQDRGKETDKYESERRYHESEDRVWITSDWTKKKRRQKHYQYDSYNKREYYSHRKRSSRSRSPKFQSRSSSNSSGSSDKNPIIISIVDNELPKHTVPLEERMKVFKETVDKRSKVDTGWNASPPKDVIKLDQLQEKIKSLVEIGNITDVPSKTKSNNMKNESTSRNFEEPRDLLFNVSSVPEVKPKIYERTEFFRQELLNFDVSQIDTHVDEEKKPDSKVPKKSPCIDISPLDQIFEKLSEDNMKKASPRKVPEKVANPQQKTRLPETKPEAVPQRSMLFNPENPEMVLQKRLSNPENPETVLQKRLSNPENPETVTQKRLSNPENPETVTQKRLSNPENPETVPQKRLPNPETIPQRLSNPENPTVVPQRRLSNPENPNIVQTKAPEVKSQRLSNPENPEVAKQNKEVPKVVNGEGRTGKEKTKEERQKTESKSEIKKKSEKKPDKEAQVKKPKDDKLEKTSKIKEKVSIKKSSSSSSIKSLDRKSNEGDDKKAGDDVKTENKENKKSNVPKIDSDKKDSKKSDNKDKKIEVKKSETSDKKQSDKKSTTDKKVLPKKSNDKDDSKNCKKTDSKNSEVQNESKKTDNKTIEVQSDSKKIDQKSSKSDAKIKKVDDKKKSEEKEISDMKKVPEANKYATTDRKSETKNAISISTELKKPVDNKKDSKLKSVKVNSEIKIETDIRKKSEKVDLEAKTGDNKQNFVQDKKIDNELDMKTKKSQQTIKNVNKSSTAQLIIKTEKDIEKPNATQQITKTVEKTVEKSAVSLEKLKSSTKTVEKSTVTSEKTQPAIKIVEKNIDSPIVQPITTTDEKNVEKPIVQPIIKTVEKNVEKTNAIFETDDKAKQTAENKLTNLDTVSNVTKQNESVEKKDISTSIARVDEKKSPQNIEPEKRTENENIVKKKELVVIRPNNVRKETKKLKLKRDNNRIECKTKSVDNNTINVPPIEEKINDTPEKTEETNMEQLKENDETLVSECETVSKNAVPVVASRTQKEKPPESVTEQKASKWGIIKNCLKKILQFPTAKTTESTTVTEKNTSASTTDDIVYETKNESLPKELEEKLLFVFTTACESAESDFYGFSGTSSPVKQDIEVEKPKTRAKKRKKAMDDEESEIIIEKKSLRSRNKNTAIEVKPEPAKKQRTKSKERVEEPVTVNENVSLSDSVVERIHETILLETENVPNKPLTLKMKLPKIEPKTKKPNEKLTISKALFGNKLKMEKLKMESECIPEEPVMLNPFFGMPMMQPCFPMPNLPSTSVTAPMPNKKRTKEEIMNRMITIDIEIQKLMQEKWDLYKELQISSQEASETLLAPDEIKTEVIDLTPEEVETNQDDAIGKVKEEVTPKSKRRKRDRKRDRKKKKSESPKTDSLVERACTSLETLESVPVKSVNNNDSSLSPQSKEDLEIVDKYDKNKINFVIGTEPVKTELDTKKRLSESLDDSVNVKRRKESESDDEKIKNIRSRRTRKLPDQNEPRKRVTRRLVSDSTERQSDSDANDIVTKKLRSRLRNSQPNISPALSDRLSTTSRASSEVSIDEKGLTEPSEQDKKKSKRKRPELKRETRRKTKNITPCFVQLQRMVLPVRDVESDHPEDDLDIKSPEDECDVVSSTSDNATIEDLALLQNGIYCKAHTKSILDLKIVGEEFLAASEDGCIYRYCIRTGKLNGLYSGHMMAVTCLFVPKEQSDSEKVFFSGSLDCCLKSYNIESCNLMQTVTVDQAIQCMDSAWGYIFLGTYDGLLFIYDIKKKRLHENSITVASATVLMVRATTEGSRQVLILASRKREIMVRDAFSGLLLRTMCEEQKPTIYSLLLERNYVYCGTSDKGILVLDFNSGNQIRMYNAGKGVVCMLIYKGLLFAGCYDGMIYIFDTKTNSHVSTIGGPGEGMLLSLAIVDDLIIAGTKKDHLLKIWKIPEDVMPKNALLV